MNQLLQRWIIGVSLIFCSGCGVGWNILDIVDLFNDGSGSSSGPAAPPAPTPSPTAPVIEATDVFALALGGVAPGRDELVLMDDAGVPLDFSQATLDFMADLPNVAFLPRTGFSSFAAGSGAQLIPQKVGVSYVTYLKDGTTQEPIFQVTIPPQSLIQILLGEARGQLDEEAEATADGAVALTSLSPTGNAIAAVVRTRVELTHIYGEGLFVVDPLTWSLNPPASYYDAVIDANDGAVYQFSPVNPNDPSFAVYQAAAARDFLDTGKLIAYDQAVLTAAAIFNETVEDPTGGAFAFQTPTSAEYNCLLASQQSGATQLPICGGVSDGNFPFFAPVQVVFLPGISPLADGRPAFLFIRPRDPSEPAITDVP